MKVILRSYGIRQDAQQKTVAKATARDLTLTRGTAQVPQPPRELIAQSGPRGILVTWSLPSGLNTDIQRWRVYKGDENTLYADINDRGTRQCFVEATAGATPPVTNIFISSMNMLGVESPKVQVQGAAIAEAGAPAMPSVPPGYTSGNSGGGSKGRNFL
jgi:hypothetical protein